LRKFSPAQEKLSQAVCCAGEVYMNRIDSHNRVDEGVTVGSYRINRLLFADALVLLASSQQSLQHSIGFQLRATEPEWKSVKIPRYYVSLKPKAVYTASERQHTAAGEEVQAPRSGI